MDLNNMGMKPINSWDNKTTVIKGNIGEKLVLEFLEGKGFIVYEPATQSAHGFDKLAVKDKKLAIIAEVKTKARMNKYEATGFNVNHYEEYKFISQKHNLPIFIFFVDEHLKSIYGNWLTELEKEIDGFPLKINDGKIILFSLKNMREVAKISNEQCEELKINSTRNYEYL